MAESGHEPTLSQEHRRAFVTVQAINNFPNVQILCPQCFLEI